MKKLNIILAGIFCFLMIVSGNAQTSMKADRDKAEKNTSPFTVKYFQSKEKSHYVLIVNVVDKKIVLDEKSKIVEVSGNLPNEVGQFLINILDRNGERIGKLKMRDPFLIWTSEKEKNEVTYLEKGKIHIALPKNTKIAKLELIRGKEVIQKLDVSKLMEELLRRRG